MRLIGWLSSLILVLTIVSQIHRQWRTGTSKGVSLWLYLGQIAASTGFVVYSAMVDDLVFVVTNSLMLVSAGVGIGIMLHQRRRDQRRGARRESTSAPSALHAT